MSWQNKQDWLPAVIKMVISTIYIGEENSYENQFNMLPKIEVRVAN